MFSEQEIGKATLNVNTEAKDKAKNKIVQKIKEKEKKSDER